MAGKSSLDEALERLARHAERLSAKSDEVNSLIARTNEQLAHIKPGLAVWMREILEPAGDSQEESGYRLGFAKVQDQWQLAVKKVTIHHKLYQGDEEQPYVEEIAGDVVPLVVAPRIVRVQACQHLSEVVEALADRAKQLVNGIDEAIGSRKARR